VELLEFLHFGRNVEHKIMNPCFMISIL